MKKEETTNKNQTQKYPYKTTVANDSFEHVFALYRSRVHDYINSLFLDDCLGDHEEPRPDTY